MIQHVYQNHMLFISFQELISIITGNLYPLTNIFLFFPPLPQSLPAPGNYQFTVSPSLAFLDATYLWYNAIFCLSLSDLFHLAYCPSCWQWQEFLLYHGWIIFHCVQVVHKGPLFSMCLPTLVISCVFDDSHQGHFQATSVASHNEELERGLHKCLLQVGGNWLQLLHWHGEICDSIWVSGLNKWVDIMPFTERVMLFLRSKFERNNSKLYFGHVLKL